jgi:transcriptional pleiotropic regulator of transition state genes
MKSTGIVRKIDELGRIVLPIEMRRTLEIAERDPMEIYVDGDKIILVKYVPRKLSGKKKYVCADCGRELSQDDLDNHRAIEVDDDEPAPVVVAAAPRPVVTRGRKPKVTPEA